MRASLERLPDEALFVLAQHNCAGLALLCRRLAAFWARPEARREAALSYYRTLSNRGKYLFLSRAAQASPASLLADAYDALFPRLAADEAEGFRLAAALYRLPEAALPAAADRLAALVNARPDTLVIFALRADTFAALKDHQGLDRERVRKEIESFPRRIAAYASGATGAFTDGLPVCAWGSPAHMRRLRASGAPLCARGAADECEGGAFGLPGPRHPCGCAVTVMLFGTDKKNCECMGTSILAALYQRAATMGDAAEIVRALEECAAPLPPEHGGDGSEDKLDLGDPLLTRQLQTTFAAAGGVLAWLDRRARRAE